MSSGTPLSVTVNVATTGCGQRQLFALTRGCVLIGVFYKTTG